MALTVSGGSGREWGHGNITMALLLVLADDDSEVALRAFAVLEQKAIPPTPEMVLKEAQDAVAEVRRTS